MNRYWEIDATRGTAVVLMVLFNYAFALDYLKIYTLTEGWAFWWLFPRLVAGTFIFVAGISLTISYSRSRSWERQVRRGLKIFSLGMLITAATFLLIPEATVWFGILHFIGLSIILSLLFIKTELRYLLVAGVVALTIGIYLNNFVFDFPWLLWLGFFLIGMAAGKKFYHEGKRQFSLREIKTTKPINFLGRHSLIIYLLHQPVLLILLRILGLF